MNPYGQAGWTSSGGSSSSYPSLAPSVYGALPFSGSSSSSSNDFLLTFHFAFNPTITNCTVTGPNSRTYFRITDNAPSPGFTLFQNSEGKSVAIIEWRRSPGHVVEIRDIVQKQLVSTWLAISRDQTYRTMNARGLTLVWTARDNYVGLFTTGTSSVQCYAKIIRGSGSLTLQMTSQAVQLGLLEPCVVAAVLLQSGRQID
ncbi:hypothetical protein V5O48_016159 [Marasmius crinis-equi]|uniref:DUF6593 domain-containing protein n=1 Tax=Marasmius crinis-equi TaxID=585013 RepID=A0ABR3ESH3_9AGAR